MTPSTSLWAPQFAHQTDEGVRGKHNDDAFDYFVGRNSEQDKIYFLTVADGVTSNAGGDQASDIAIAEIRGRLEELGQEPLLEQMTDAVHYAHKQILKTAQENPAFCNMSTTIVLAAIDQDKLYVTHLGDSRAYLIRNNQIYLLTVDHTWVQDAVDQGRLSIEEAQNHPNRHVIKRFLGIQKTISIDYHIVRPNKNHLSKGERSFVKQISLQANDLILLCTDGLTDKVTDAEICATITAQKSLQEATNNLIDIALARQESDNITVVLMKLIESPTVSHHPNKRFLNTTILVVLAIAILMLSMTAYTLYQIDSDVREWVSRMIPLFQSGVQQVILLLYNVQA